MRPELESGGISLSGPFVGLQSDQALGRSVGRKEGRSIKKEERQRNTVLNDGDDDGRR